MMARRWSRYVLVLALLVPWVGMMGARPAAAFPGEGIIASIPCASLPGPVKLLCDTSSGVGGQPGTTGGATAPGTPVGAAKDVVSAVADCATDPIGCFGKAVAGTAGAIITLTNKVIDSGSGPDLLRPEFIDRYARLMVVGILLLAGKLAVVFIRQAFNGSVGQAARAIFLEMPAALAAMAYLPALLTFALSVADALTQLVTLGTTEQTQAWLDSLGQNIAKVSLPGGGFTLVVVAILMLLGGLVLFFEAVLRGSLMYAAALFGPVGVTGIMEAQARPRTHKYFSFLMCLIFAKPLVYGVLALGAALLTTNSFEGIMSGLGLLFVAVFAVGMLFAWLPGQVEGVIHAAQARHQAGRAAGKAVPSQQSMLRSGSQAHGRGGGRTSGGSGGPKYAAKDAAKIGTSGNPWIDAGYRGAKAASAPARMASHGVQDQSAAASGKSGGSQATTWSGTDPWSGSNPWAAPARSTGGRNR